MIKFTTAKETPIVKMVKPSKKITVTKPSGKPMKDGKKGKC